MVRIRVPRKYGVQREIELERSRQNEDFNRRLKNAEDSMKAIYPEEYKKIRSRYFGSGNNLGLIGSQYNYIHDMITRRSDDQMKKYYNELNDYFIKQTGTQPGYMLPDADVHGEYNPQGKIRDLTVVTPNSDYLNTVSANNAKQSVYNSDASAFNTGYDERLRDENPTAYDTWERAQNSPIVTAMEFSPLFPVVAGVKSVAAANAPQASAGDVAMNAAFAALPAVPKIPQISRGIYNVLKENIGDYKNLYNTAKELNIGNPLTRWVQPIIHEGKLRNIVGENNYILNLNKEIDNNINKANMLERFRDEHHAYREWVKQSGKDYEQQVKSAGDKALEELRNDYPEIIVDSQSGVSPNQYNYYDPNEQLVVNYIAKPVSESVIKPSTEIIKDEVVSNIVMPDGTVLPIRSTVEKTSGGQKVYVYSTKIEGLLKQIPHHSYDYPTEVIKSRTLGADETTIRGINSPESTMAIRDYKKQLLSTPLKDANGNIIEGSTLGDKAIIQGSTLNEGLYAGAPNDTEILTTRSNYNDVARALGFKPSRDTANGTGVTGHSDLAFVGGKGANENIDINILEQDNNGYAIGKEAHEIAAHLFGNEYMGNYYTKSAADGVSDISRRIPKPDINGKPTGEFFTADELFDLYKTNGDPTQKHVYDAFVQSKDKAVNRARSMLNSTNKDTINRVSDAIKSMGEQIIGYKGTKELYPNLDLTNKANNVEFLKQIGFTGDIETVSSNPDMMRNVVDYWHIRNTIATRGVSFNPGQGESLKDLLNAVTSYGGGASAGGGGNMLFGSEVGGGSSYVGTHLGGKYIPLTKHSEQITNPIQLFELSERQKDVFKNPDTKKVIDNIISEFNKTHGTKINISKVEEGRYSNELSSQLNTLLNEGKISKQEYDELFNKIADELDTYAYRGYLYDGKNYYAGNLSRVTEPTIHSVGNSRDVFGNKFEFGANEMIANNNYKNKVINNEVKYYPTLTYKKLFDYIPESDRKRFAELNMERKAIHRFENQSPTPKRRDILIKAEQIDDKLRLELDNLNRYRRNGMVRVSDNIDKIKDANKLITKVGAFGTAAVLSGFGIYKYIDTDRKRNEELVRNYLNGNMSNEQMYNTFTQYLDNFSRTLSVLNDKDWSDLNENEKKKDAIWYANQYKLLSIVDQEAFDREMEKHYSRDTINEIKRYMNSSNQRYNDEQQYYKSGGIHINPKNEGKFTESANRAGMGVQEYARHILANKENYSPTMVRRANFARNASKWKHDDGGSIPPYYKSFDEWYNSLYQNNDTTDYNLRRAYELAPTEELENWKIAPETNHLHTVYWNGDEYEFMKKRNHPTLKNELDWYNSKDGADFRMRYSLDTTGDTYRYVPRYKVRIVEP